MDQTAPSKYHHGDLRAALLEEAERQLASVGAEKISLRALARSIGVSQTAPYRHFKDKADILAALALAGYQRLSTGAKQTAALYPNDPLMAMLAMAHNHIRFVREHPQLYKLMFGPLLTPRQQYEETFKIGQEAFQHAEGLIRAGIEKGLFKPINPLNLANAAWAGIHGVAVQLLFHLDSFSENVDIDEQIKVSLQLVMDGLRRQPEISPPELESAGVTAADLPESESCTD